MPHSARVPREEEAEPSFRGIFERLPVGLYRTSPEGRLLDVNPALVELLGFPDRQTLLDTPVARIHVDPSTRDAWRAELEARGEVRDFLTQLYRHDGSPLWVREHARVVRSETGDPLFYEGAMEDVTDRRRAEEALRESEVRYRSLLEYNPHIVYGLDPEGRFTTLNPAGERVSGYTSGELLGEPFLPLILSEHVEMAQSVFARALSGEAASYELAVRAKDGHRIDLRGVSIPVVVRGEVVGVFGMAEDVTEKLRLEEQLRQAQKMEAVGRLAGGIAHDFNNILTSIRGNAQLALLDAPADAPLREELEEIERSADKAAGLTRQLLAFSRRQVMQPEILDPNAVLAEMDGMLRRLIPADVDLVTIPGPSTGLVEADPMQVQQVILNLALNARDAMPTGGRLVVWTQALRVSSPEDPAVSGVPPGDWVILAVEDTGVGMDADVRARIFEPFFTTKEKSKGTGLGLSVVYGIVTQSGGYVRVDSEPGAGTTIQVFLPQRVAGAERPVPQPSTRKLKGVETILLVEDEAAVRRLAQRVLERHGYTVLVADDGAQALSVAGRHPDEIHLLLTDVVMPHVGGPELYQRLAKVRSGLEVVYMSGYAMERLGEAGVLGPEIDFVEKPFTPHQLAERVRRALDRRKA